MQAQLVEVFQSFATILWQVITPIFVLVGIGYVIQRKVELDLKTLTRLNFWIFVPAFLFVHIYESRLTAEQLGRVFGHFVCFFGALAVLTWSIATLLGMQDRMKRALTATVLFYNSGNYGIPVAQLAFAANPLPLQVQAATVMMQNITNFTLGLALVAGGRGRRRRETLAAIFKLPMIYVLVIAWSLRLLKMNYGITIPVPVYQGLTWISDGLVPVAVITLGAQMAGLQVPPLSAPLVLSLGLRLLLAPALGFGIIHLLDIQGTLAQAILISTSFPTAVNAALLAYEYDNEPQYAAAAVFYSTLLSSVTVSVVIFLAQKFIPAG